ncbi:MAG: flagellar basal body P-ring formation chaperone FlgA [Phycisphaerae bacterium]
MKTHMAWMLILALSSTASADELFVAADVSTVRIRADAVAAGSRATLGDVLDFSQADVRLRDAVAQSALFDAADGTVPPSAITHEQVVARLEALGVNLSRVLVCGAATCRVRREPQEDTPEDRHDSRRTPPNDELHAPSRTPTAADAQPVSGAPQPIEAPLLRPGLYQPPAAEPSGPPTLADVIRDYVARDLSVPSSDVALEFERAGQDFLALTAPPWEFSIRSPAGEKFGLREFVVAIRRDGVTHRTARLMGRVKALRSVVVAKRPLAVGAFVRPDDVALEPRLFDSEAESALGSVDAVIGQNVKRFVQSGEVLRRSDLKPVELVKRSRPVTVIGADRSVQLRLSGTALDSGGFGDRVRVRLGESRREQREVRGVVTGMGTVQLEEGA